MIPSAGEIYDGYRFLGGDPNDEKSWERFDNKPRPGDIIEGYRFKGGNPSAQESWEEFTRLSPEIEEAQKAAVAGEEYWTGGVKKPEPAKTIPAVEEYRPPVTPEEQMAEATLERSVTDTLPKGSPVSERPLEMPRLRTSFDSFGERRTYLLGLGAAAEQAIAAPAPAPTRPGPTLEAARQLEQQRIIQLAQENIGDIEAARKEVSRLYEEYPDLSQPKERDILTYSTLSSGARFIANMGDALYMAAEAGEKNIVNPDLVDAVKPGIVTSLQNLAASLFPRDDEGKIKRLELSERFEQKAKELAPSILNKPFDEAWNKDQAFTWVAAKIANSSDSTALAVATMLVPKLAPLTAPIIFASSAGGAFAEDRAAGRSVEQATLAAQITGGAELAGSAFDVLLGMGAGKALGSLVKSMSAAEKEAVAASLVGRAIKGMAVTSAAALGSGTGEAATSLIQDLSKKYVSERDPGDMGRNAKESFIVGFWMGPLFSAVGAAPRIAERVEEIGAERAAEQARLEALEKARGLIVPSPRAETPSPIPLPAAGETIASVGQPRMVRTYPTPIEAPTPPVATRSMEQVRDEVQAAQDLDSAIATADQAVAEVPTRAQEPVTPEPTPRPEAAEVRQEAAPVAPVAPISEEPTREQLLEQIALSVGGERPITTGAPVVAETATRGAQEQPAITQEQVDAAKERANTLEVGDAIVTDLGDRLVINFVRKDKAGNVIGVQFENSPYMFDTDSLVTFFTPQPYFTESGERKFAPASTIEKAEPRIAVPPTGRVEAPAAPMTMEEFAASFPVTPPTAEAAPRAEGVEAARVEAVPAAPETPVEAPRATVESVKAMKKAELEAMPSVDLSRMMGEMRETKPRTVAQMFGRNPTPEQVKTQQAKISAWNNQYSRVSKAQKIAQERDNAAFRAAQIRPAEVAAPAEMAQDVLAGKEIRPPTDDIYEVAQANFNYPRMIGNQNVPIEDLKGGVPEQWRELERVDRLAVQIASDKGFFSRIIVDQNNNVIEGQHRLEAMRKLGAKTVPVYKIEDMGDTFPVARMEAAILEAQPMRDEQATQIVQRALDAIAETGSIQEAAKLVIPRYQRAYLAALNAIEPVAPAAQAPTFEDAVAPKTTKKFQQGQVVTFTSEKQAAAYAKAQKLEGYAPREVDGVWRLSRRPQGEITVGLSAATPSILGISELYKSANAGDELAHTTLQLVAEENIKHLLSRTNAKVITNATTGLYGGAIEPSLTMSVTFDEADRASVLAALAKFASNFNQEQIHVRIGSNEDIGFTYDDGSYVTPVYRLSLESPLSRKEIENVIEQSGLYGLTFSDSTIEAYFVGDPSNEGEVNQFKESIRRAEKLLEGKYSGIEENTERLWTYGDGERGLGFDTIQGDVPAGEGISNETARKIAAYLNAEVDVATGRRRFGPVRTFEQQDISPQQEALQTRIAEAYDAMPVNDLENPNVRRAYEELADEVLRQYKAIPTKVEVYSGKAEPYKNSEEMRRDLLDNNHLFIYATTPETFGPPGQDFADHPLLKDSGLKDQNGYRLLFNDLLRAVHDYYAHSMSPVQFGPKGEEAAWKNHMAMTRSPWARWALTAETRGQNSWVNFRPDLDRATPAKDRPFAEQKAALLPLEFSLVGDNEVDAPVTRLIETIGEEASMGSLGRQPLGEERAVQKPSAEALPVREGARGGEAVGERDAQREEAAREGRAREEGAEEVEQPTRQRLVGIANRLGILYNETTDKFSSGGGVVNIPAEDAQVESSISPDHVFAHELGHAILTKRGVSLDNKTPVSMLREWFPSWDAMVNASREFRPAVWGSNVDKIRRHANKPSEIVSDAIGSILLGNSDFSLIDGSALGLTRRDLGIDEAVIRTEEARQEEVAFREADYRPSVVNWAKKEFGDRVAPNGNPVWQNFVKWSDGLPAVENGNVDYKGGPAFFVSYHGTTHDDIVVFKKTGNREGFLGEGPYFTTSTEDASVNYAGIGPDLTGRIERESEAIADGFREDSYFAREVLEGYFARNGMAIEVTEENLDDLSDEYGDAAIKDEAANKLKGKSEGLMMKVFVKLNKPADTTGKGEDLTYEYDTNEDGDIINERGTLLDWIEATRSVVNQYGIDADRYISSLLDEGGSVGMDTAFSLSQKHFQEAYDDNGDLLSSGAIFREIAQEAGYDGIVMDADLYFGSGRRGFGGVRMSMAGVESSTLHIVPFSGTQVKSATGNNGNFGTEPSIVENLNRPYTERAAFQGYEEIPGFIQPSRRLRTILKRLDDGKITEEQFVVYTRQLSNEMSSAARNRADVQERIRGADIIREKLIAARRREELDSDLVDFALWLLDQNPAIASGLGVSVREAGERDAGVAGRYNPANSVLTIFKYNNQSDTGVHEILHHAERMMPAEIQNAIRAEWQKAYAKALSKAEGKEREALLLVMDAMAGSYEAKKKLLEAFKNGTLNYDKHYHLTNPSEFWAVKASTIMRRRYEADSWIAKAKNWLSTMLEKAKAAFGFRSDAPIIRGLEAVMSGKANEPKGAMLSSLSEFMNIEGTPLQYSVDDPTKFDLVQRTFQDQLVDLKAVEAAVTKVNGQMIDEFTPSLQFELFLSRTAQRDLYFNNYEVMPLQRDIAARGLTGEEVNKFLHARHAPSRNREMAKRNPNAAEIKAKIASIEAAIKKAEKGSEEIKQLRLDLEAWKKVEPYKGPESDRLALSGMSTEEAREYLDGLDEKKRADLEAIAKRVDAIIEKTAETGYIQRNEEFEHYVPLYREGFDEESGFGVGKGFSVAKQMTKTAGGSTREVSNILAAIIAQRYAANNWAEKNRVAQSMVGFAMSVGDNDIWSVGPTEKVAYLDPRTGTVKMKPKFGQEFSALIPDGKGGFVAYSIYFNKQNERAKRISEAMSGMDVEKLNMVLAMARPVTRWYGNINTQWNPLFGFVNYKRDLQSSVIQTIGTEIQGEHAELVKRATLSLKDLWSEIRAQRRGESTDTEVGKALRDFQDRGGPTAGFRGIYDRAKIEKDITRYIRLMSEPSAKGMAFRQWEAFKAVTGYAIADYNNTLELAIRLSAYRLGLEKGMSKDRAAMLAKDITVNFDRRGTASRQIGALYAFYTPAVQQIERMARLFDIKVKPNGIPTMGKRGQKIIGSLVLAGVAQGFILQAAGIDEDEIKDYVKDKNWVIPIDWLKNLFPGAADEIDVAKKYLTMPMALSYNIFVAIGRQSFDYVNSGFKDPGKRAMRIFELALDFNPFGSSSLAQTLSPTATDPFVALLENRDWLGNKIFNERFDKFSQEPGWMRGRDNASKVGTMVAMGINWFFTGGLLGQGTIYSRPSFSESDIVSPTPDQIDYLLGQAFGGAGRETLKLQKTISAKMEGEEVPPQSRFFISRYYGESRPIFYERSRFYENVNRMLKHKAEIDGRKEAGANYFEYMDKNPESVLADQARAKAREVQALNKERRQLIKDKGDKYKIKDLEIRITDLMADFNNQVDSYKQ